MGAIKKVRFPSRRANLFWRELRLLNYVDLLFASSLELDHSGGHSLVGPFIDEDEAAGVAVLGVFVHK